MRVHKHCPSCETELPPELHWPIDREKVFSCERCGAYHRWQTNFLIPFTLGLILVKLVAAVGLGIAGLWAILIPFILVSIPVVTFLLYLGFQPEPVDFGKVADGRIKKDDLNTTLH
ncbi:MAG: hypothetical protein NXI03_06080 [Alphaproteobacteria bacterium]|jgi:fatty acid desaturase|uniref:hypothetical protein n=1 Tax=Maricaulis alexandrii TaxID=2570354 RepID=UPI00110A0477|nr:hypothetical protein [Maricaulis alexandrii]MCR9267123.1 hypothetical protein [Alphaproteobacteria bacterium]